MDKNAANEGVISAAASRVAVRVIRTNEGRMIAHLACPEHSDLTWPAKNGIPTIRRNTSIRWICYRRRRSSPIIHMCAVNLRTRLWLKWKQTKQKGRNVMSHKQHESCIEACNECVTACEHCATSCLHEQDVKAMARCIELDRDCADLCSLAAQFMSRGSTYAAKLCALCAEICQACGDECAKHKHEHCQQCAKACHKCAEECRNMAKK